MGIIAFCPNRHRVRVKDELAGRKGICPQCGAKFRIPSAAEQTVPIEPAAQTAAAASARPAAGRSSAAPSLPVATIVSLDPTLAATLPRVLPLAGR